jgi:hypothetical protein
MGEKWVEYKKGYREENIIMQIKPDLFYNTMCNAMFKFKGDICTERKTYYLMVLKCVNIMK